MERTDFQVNPYNIRVAMFDSIQLLYSIIATESETAEKEIEMKQNEVYGINTRPL